MLYNLHGRNAGGSQVKTDAPQEVGSGISRRKLSFSGKGKVQHEVHEKQRKREFEKDSLDGFKKRYSLVL